MTTMGVEYRAERAAGKWWWLLLVSGILWILIGLFVLEAHYNSAVLIGYLVAVWLLFAGVAEFVRLSVFPGWRWLRIALGVLFLVGGVAALLSPFQTFTILAGLMGLFLIIKGVFDFALGLAERGATDLWWLTLVLAVIEVMLGIWAAGYPGRSAALLIVWVGVGAIVRGIVDIVAAFSRPALEVAA
jgi:uncharacterized membrane protein HdeD (DUF308 family)